MSDAKSTDQTTFVPSQKWRAGFHVVLSTLALTVIVGIANYLALRHPVRVQWTNDDRFQLSPLTLNLLESVTNEVRVIVYHNPSEDDSMYSSVAGLLNEYHHANPLIRVERIDYLRDRKRAQQAKTQFELNAQGDSDLVIFSSGDRHRFVRKMELSEYDTDNLLTTGEIKRVGFKGELLFTSAILNITDQQQIQSYYVRGHSEHELDSDALDGYSSFKRVLEEKNVGISILDLRRTASVPEDCQLLVIAGPATGFHPSELAAIDLYLQQGGRLLVLANRRSVQVRTGLEDLLHNWGFEFGFNVVDEPHQVMGDLHVHNFADHPLVTPLVEAKLNLVMTMPRSISPAAANKSAAAPAQPIALTCQEGETLSRFSNNIALHDRARDRRGVIPLIACLERPATPDGILPSGETRIIVAGDSLFLSNARIDQQGNRDFAGLAVSWLLDRYHLLGGIGPRPIQEFRITIPESDIPGLRWLLMAIMPGGVFLFGFAVWLRRRS